MSDQTIVRQDDRVLAALAHGSILLGPITNGIGGLVAALAVWLIQREKSRYVAFQALQALVYQVATFLVISISWCCWVGAWLLLILPPVMANPGAYEDSPPAGMWLGLALMIIPVGVWFLTMLYGLVGAVQSLRGKDFRYAIIGNWVKAQS